MSPPGLTEWWLTIGPSKLITDPPNTLRLSGSVCVQPQGGLSDQTDALRLPLTAAAAPPGFADALLPPDILVPARAIVDLPGNAELRRALRDPLDEAALRMIVLHHWRRICLRDVTWMHMSLETNGIMTKCAKRVASLLAEMSALSVRSSTT
jgi:hypothetical protein